MSEPVTTRRRAETRARIVRAAVEVFAEHGIMASTVEQICERAGFSRGAFYSNFDSKNAVCLGIIDDETRFYTDAFRRGGTASLAHFGAHPDDLRLGPYEVIERVAELVMHPFVDVADDERAATPRTLGLLYSELGLYAAREPEVRAAYHAYADGMVNALEQVLLPLLALTGLQFTVPSRDAAELIMAIYETATRKALLAESPEQVLAIIKPEVMLALRLVTTPRPDRAGGLG